MITFIKRKIREYLYRCVSLSEKDVKAFHEKFPNKCMICSFTRFGIEMGYLPEKEEAEPHNCIELQLEAPKGEG